MKKAKLWAYLMSGLLTFSTLASDYQIAYAEEAVEADAAAGSDVIEEPKLGEEDGFVMQMVGAGAPVEGGEEDSDTPDEPSILEEGETEGDGSSDKIPVVEGTDGKLIEQEESEEPSESDGVADGVVADSDTIIKDTPVYVGETFVESVGGTVTKVAISPEGAGTAEIDGGSVTFKAGDSKADDVLMTITYTTGEGESAVTDNTMVVSFSIAEKPAVTKDPVSTSVKKTIAVGKSVEFTVPGSFTEKDVVCNSSNGSVDINTGFKTVTYTAGETPTETDDPIIITITYTTVEDGIEVTGNTVTLEITVTESDPSIDTDSEDFVIEETEGSLTLKSDAGAFPAGTNVTFKPGTATRNSLKSLVDEGFEIVDFESYDITFSKGGQTVQPAENKIVSLKFDVNYAGATSYFIFHGNSKVSDGKTCQADSFSEWGVVGVKKTVTGPVIDENTKYYPNGDKKLKFSVEWSTVSSAYGGKVIYRESAPRNEGKDVVEKYVVEIPGNIATDIQSKYPGFHVEWADYEIQSKEVHINGQLFGPYKVEQIAIDSDNNETVLSSDEREGRLYESHNNVIQSATEADKRLEGYEYVTIPGKTKETLKIGSDASQNVIKLYFRAAHKCSYRIDRYVMGDSVDSSTLLETGSEVEVMLSNNEPYTYTLTETDTKYKDGYKYLPEHTVNGSFTLTTADTETKVVKLYYEAPTAYTINYYCADLDGNYSDSITFSETVSDQENGATIDKSSRPEMKDRAGIMYKLDASHPGNNTSITLDPDSAKNSIDAYYKVYKTSFTRDGKTVDRGGKNEVWFSLIYPHYGIPTVDRQDTSRFYPTNFVNNEPKFQGRWRGTADYLPAGTWNVYDESGINFATYGIKMDEEAEQAFKAYLGLFGGEENVRVIWYNYKNDNHDYNAAWFVNGIILPKEGTKFAYFVYDQNYPDGAVVEDEVSAKTANYIVKGTANDSLNYLTQREGWNFLGWSLDKDAETGDPTYAPGQKIDRSRLYHFYAIWEKAPVSDLVTITAPSGSKEYDASPLLGSDVTKGKEVIESSGLPDGYYVTDAVTHGSITNVEEEGALKDDQGYYVLNEFGSGDLTVEDLGSDGTGSSSAKPYVILDDKGNDVTSLFTNVTLIPGKLRITPVPLTVTTGSDWKYYDGTPLTCTEADIKTADGVSVNNEFAVVVATGSVTDVTPKPVDNTYGITWIDGVKSSNFSITENLGKLEVKSNPTPPSVKKVTLTAASASRVYNGEELTATSVTAKGLPAGYTYTATATGSRTDVGDSVNEVASDYVIYNASHAVATSEFEVETVKGTISVLPRPVTVKTGTKSKVYDGTPLVCEEASITNLAEGDAVTVKATGTITEVGSTPNTYEIDWGTVNKGNYTVSEELGTLTISETNEEILVTVIGGTYLYDGEAHGPIITVTGAGISYTNDASNGTPIDNLGAGEAAYFVEEASSTTKLIDVSSEAADVNKLVIRNASGADVTSKLKITKDTSNSTVKVVPVPVTITTKSASKVYDGSALTAGGSIDGLVAKDKAEVVFTVIGSQKEVGSSKNTYSLDWGIASPDNYTVTENIGTLRVTAVDDPTPDDPTGDPDTPSGDPTPTPGPGPDPNPVVPNITPGTPNPADGVPAIVPTATTTIPDDAVPLAGVLGETRGIEADAASVLGARVPAAQGVLGARRDAQTADSNQMALYLILMGIATGVGGAYISSRRHKRDFLNDLEMMQ